MAEFWQLTFLMPGDPAGIAVDLPRFSGRFTRTVCQPTGWTSLAVNIRPESIGLS